VAAAVAVVGGVGQGRTLDGLTASGALHGSAVDEQQIALKAGTFTSEDAHQPLDRLGQPPAALEIPRLGGELGKQVAKTLAATARKRRSDGMPMIAWATHSVTTSASVTLRRAFFGFSGRRSSAVT
jgi:hypothetical protein